MGAQKGALPPLALWAIHPQGICVNVKGQMMRAGWARSELGRGALIGLPIVLGYFPIAFSFGVAATKAGLSPIEAVTMSMLMYSGAAQFLAIALIAAGAGFWVMLAALAGMSLRHVLYGPSLLRAAGLNVPPRGAMVWGFGLTDEVFGAALGALGQGQRFSGVFISGLAVASYAAWVGGTAVGAVAGAGALQGWPALDAGLGFMLTALFLALLLSIMRRAQLPVIAAALVGTALASMVSTTAGIMAGMILGALVGTVMRGQDAA
jgi:4-azaleucine resistance transporter AzlC